MKCSANQAALMFGTGLLLLMSGAQPDDPPGLSPVQRRILEHLHGSSQPVAYCWSPDTDPRISRSFVVPESYQGTSLYDFQDTNHWATTATDGSGLGRGDPITLTWGILPDGVSISSGGEPTSPSKLIQMLDQVYGPGPGGADLTQRPWFQIFQDALDLWAAVIGVRYVYEPNDDGAAFPDMPGMLGVRPDLRIGGHSIDGSTGANIFAYNFFPDLGDMVIDTDNSTTFLTDTAHGFVLFKNLVSHEQGHGLGLGHSCPVDQTKLMEPIIATNFLGPQHDDILGSNRGYGDRYEFPSRNDSPFLATPLGTLASGDTLRETNLSIENKVDDDFFTIDVPDQARLSVTVDPVGFTYFNSPELAGGECPIGWYFNSRIRNDLGFEVRGHSGSNVLAAADVHPAGQSEAIQNLLLVEGEGTYFIRIFGDTTEVQLYDLTVTINQGAPPVAVCKNVTTCNGGVSIARFDNGSYDPDGDALTFSTDPQGPFAPGVTPVRFIVSDGVYADSCDATITVNRPPVAVASPVSATADSSQGCLAAVEPGAFDQGSSDPDGDALTFSVVPSGPYAEGVHPVTFIATDRCGVSDSVSTTVTVTCTTPVRLLAFDAAREEGRGILTWEVADVTDHAGFHVHRAERGGARVRLTESLLRGDGSGSYRYVDDRAPAGVTDYWLEEVSRGGVSTWFGPTTLEAAPLGTSLVLRAGSNPVRGGTQITYALPLAGEVSLAVFDPRGARVRTLESGLAGAGEHRVAWDGRDDEGNRLAAGLYLIRLQSAEGGRVVKVVLTP